MSDNKNIDSIFTNEQTRQRRAWIARALESVRRQDHQHEYAVETEAKSTGPRLRVVGSSRPR